MDDTYRTSFAFPHLDSGSRTCAPLAAALVLILSGIIGCGSKPAASAGSLAAASGELGARDPTMGTHIDLTGQQGTDALLAKMQDKLPEAGSLVLHQTDVTGAGLRHLRSATRLRTLDLRETSITDQDLQNLRGMAQLTYLVLDGSRVTPEGVAAVREFLPRTAVTPLPNTDQRSSL